MEDYIERTLEEKTWNAIIDNLLNNQHGITEIETNGNNLNDHAPVSLFYKKHGQRIELKNLWANSEEYTNHIGELIDAIGGDIDSKFLEEGRLKLSTGETARVHIVLPPAVDYPQVTIAKKSSSLKTLETLRETGQFDKTVLRFLKMAIDCKFTAILSGPTGAGKTTLLEAMTHEFSEDERIGIVEDSQELQLSQPNTTYLHSTLWKPGMNENDVASLSWCVQQLNRQRVDKIIIGETRGKEFSDFIVAANSGCAGSMTTIHANNPKMALQKMTNFMIIGLPEPVRSANESISQTVDIIIQLGFDKYGKNKILKIENVSETLNKDSSASIATNPWITYDESSKSWKVENSISDKIHNVMESNGYDILTFEKKSSLNHRQNRMRGLRDVLNKE